MHQAAGSVAQSFDALGTDNNSSRPTQMGHTNATHRRIATRAEVGVLGFLGEAIQFTSLRIARCPVSHPVLELFDSRY